MKQSKIVFKNENPFLSVDTELFPACAYITYFEEHNDYKAFADVGFRIYSVSVSLADQPINTTSGFSPHADGVFDQKGKADFSYVDEAIERILESCPDAYIFPRIYVTMPEWWIEENPKETVPVPHEKRREALYSKKFREDAATMLSILIEHFKTFFAAKNIIGYQISGGNTQEWFHLDLNGSYCENALPYFNEYLQEKGLPSVEKLPNLAPLKECATIEDPILSAYIRFANDGVAETVEFLCKAAKEAVDQKQIVGVFYGYTLEVSHHPLWGTHSLAKLLDSPHIDFFSSPNSYVEGRALGVDWSDMIPVDSVRLHGKLCFMECDIRTHLTKLPNESRPGCDPYHVYVGNVFKGPPSEETSVWAVRKSLARQLTHRHGLWWFDMFGHWYATPALMAEMRRTLPLYARRLIAAPYEYPVEVAVFLDENAYSKIGEQHPAFSAGRKMRVPLGAAGAPYHLYLLSDVDRIDRKNYKAVLFLIPDKCALVEKAKEKLRESGIHTLTISAETPFFSAEQLADFYKKSGVFLYCNAGDVVYFGNGYATLHAASAGKKVLNLPEALCCTDLISGEQYKTNRLILQCRQYETKLFKVEKEK